MTERYSFHGDKPLISIDNSVVWSPNASTLADTMTEGYVTCDETTQYLSALEDDDQNEITLDNLNLTLTNQRNEIIIGSAGSGSDTNNVVNDDDDGTNFLHTADGLVEQQNDEIGENQCVVYTMEGSDELYGIQLAQDEDGNIQKYQFQFRKYEDGQLEPIPETIQILPMTDEEIKLNSNPTNTEYLNLQEQLQHTNEDGDDDGTAQITRNGSIQIYVENENNEEHILPDHCDDDLQTETYDDGSNTIVYENTAEHDEIDEEIHDIKPNPTTLLIKPSNIKVEDQTSQDYIDYKSDNLIENECTTQEDEEQQYAALEDGQGFDGNLGVEFDQEFEELDEEHANNSATDEELHTLETQFNHQQHSELSNEYNVLVNHEQEEEHGGGGINEQNNSENEEFEVIEGLHITGDMDPDEDSQDSTQLIKNNSTIQKTNILRQGMKNSKEITEIRKDNRFFLYFVHPEKENVDSTTLNNTELYKSVRTNPRSVLKSSYQGYFATQPKVETATSNDYNDRLSKRFAKNKEAIQARILHDFINKTTIPLAPIRKDRLPRKQQIKPVERQDEEIVVQEMMISSNGFVESTGAEHKKNLEVTEYVELSDSDDDYDPKTSGKKKKKNKKQKTNTEITISDSDSDNSVIEVDLTDDNDSTNKKEQSSTTVVVTENLKKRRGRSSKSESLESPLKKLNLDENNLKKSSNNEIHCTKCSKLFPSQISLKTHLQQTHNVIENNIKSTSEHKCTKCGKEFKNRILLSRHECNINTYTCVVCKKKFPDNSSLIKHKRIHAKEQLCKSTTIEKVSPKKIKPPVFKSPKKAINFKCKHCSKVCSTLSSLNVHVRTHKEFTCTTCSSTFPSKILLDAHVRAKCVKSPKNNRRQSTVIPPKQQQPPQRVLRKSTRLPVLNNLNKTESNIDKQDTASSSTSSLNITSVPIKVTCDSCSAKFNTHKALFKHKVAQHGFDTPDKKSLQPGKKKLHKERSAHSGIPVQGSLKTLYSELKTKLNDV